MKWNHLLFWIIVVATLGALTLHFVRNLASRNSRLAAIEKQRSELQEIIKRLTGRSREAQLIVQSRKLDRRGRVVRTVLLWREFAIGKDGRPVALPIRRITIPGDEPYVGGYVLQFADSFVEAGNALRGKSVGFFTNIFSKSQPPDHGTSLLNRDGVPPILEPRYGPANPFALTLWRQIRRLIRSRRAAGALGLRVVQRQYVAKPVRTGILYTIYLQNDGGFEFVAQPGHTAIINQLLRTYRIDHLKSSHPH